MTETAILAACGLLLFACLVDLVGRRFNLPSVALLIAVGIAIRHALGPAGFNLRWAEPVVPILGTLGLILIVLEGAHDLSLMRERTHDRGVERGDGRVVHLAPRVPTLVCGLRLNNPYLIRWHARPRSLRRDGYADALREFKGLVAELSFATKSCFFLMLGYGTDEPQMGGMTALVAAAAVAATVYAARWRLLQALRRDAAELLWIAPRGLIAVPLFLAAARTGTIDASAFGAVMPVVITISAAVAVAHRRAFAGALGRRQRLSPHGRVAPSAIIPT